MDIIVYATHIRTSTPAYLHVCAYVYPLSYLMIASEGDGVAGLLEQCSLLRFAILIDFNGNHGALQLDR
jgi:hypothetical protein